MSPFGASTEIVELKTGTPRFGGGIEGETFSFRGDGSK
jgi:hypothetical protein